MAKNENEVKVKFKVKCGRFLPGHEYSFPEEVAKTLVERDHAEYVNSDKKKQMKPDKKMEYVVK